MTKNNSLKPSRLWLIVSSFAAVLGALLLVWAALIAWLPSNLVLAERAARELTSALSAPVKVGNLQWQLLPVPKVVLQEISVGALASLRINRLNLYPSVLAALQGQLEFKRVEVEGSVLPQKTVHRLINLNKKVYASSLAANWLSADKPLTRLVFSDLTWIPQGGLAMHYAGQVDFDNNWRPRLADISWPESTINGETLRLNLTRLEQQERWKLMLSQGSGSTQGEISLKTTANVAKPNDLPFQLQASLQSRDMDVAGLLKAFGRPGIVSGKASGPTTMSASGADLAELSSSLHSHSELIINQSALPLFDISQAIQSNGKNYAGKTALDSLSVWLDTQNTSTGTQIDFSQIKARSNALSASGQASLKGQQIEGQFTVDLIDGLIGVPLAISGSTDQIKVSVPKAAVAGAVLGSVVLPGVGTALGARVGAALGQVLEATPAKP
ncbi:hypothetical protein [Polaromonas vacuolata]|nr:hypothetical protein [Polaromonas vacuolata]